MDSLEVKGRSERLEEKLCTDFVLFPYLSEDGWCILNDLDRLIEISSSIIHTQLFIVSSKLRYIDLMHLGLFNPVLYRVLFLFIRRRSVLLFYVVDEELTETHQDHINKVETCLQN
jgi:hypothetical protein